MRQWLLLNIILYCSSVSVKFRCACNKGNYIHASTALLPSHSRIVIILAKAKTVYNTVQIKVVSKQFKSNVYYNIVLTSFLQKIYFPWFHETKSNTHGYWPRLTKSCTMWHEARKQERKIRVMMVDYKRRADRRRQFYEQIVRLLGTQIKLGCSVKNIVQKAFISRTA